MTQKNGDSTGGDGGEKHEHFRLLQDVAEGLDKHSTGELAVSNHMSMCTSALSECRYS